MGKTILVVEDEQWLNDAAKLKLEQKGFRVLQAFRGEDGLELLKNEMPDFIWLDYLLPGMDGLEFLEAVRANPKTKDIKVAIVSVSTSPSKQEKAQTLGVVDYIVKSNHKLEDIVEKVIGFVS